ncbi:MAG: aminopeptidase P N-terminal domain-containing protein [Clostridia bacterium]|nr:aminopeptidase P N-terminal domain-containing protein [Clostridia bacterium]
MDKSFHMRNRERLYSLMKKESLLLIFSGEEVVKTNDEYYPFYAHRSFVYLTGLTCKQAVLCAVRDADGNTKECLYLLAPDPMAERWTGKRVSPAEVEASSGISDVRFVDSFDKDMHTLLAGGHYSMRTERPKYLYLDLYRFNPTERLFPSHAFLKRAQQEYAYLQVENADALIRKLRLIKEPCEIEAVRKAEEITRDGILAMMKASRPGMYEYQYKAEFDHALGQYGPDGPGFPSIISAGQNNFCIHYYAYTGQAKDGDMILNDVGAQWDNHTTDVSRSWPCNGRFSERQKLLYECALSTSNHMFATVKPGMRMADIDRTIRAYNAERLVEAGALDRVENVGKLMWHGGAHHVGYDVHDVVETPVTIAPGMVFCIDVGIYHEDWGIGFRLEDNLLVTEDGCECLSGAIPRTVEDIEDVMRKG